MQRRALIVDNEQQTCELIERVLTSVGVESLVLTRSVEAPMILQESKFDVAFFGFRMSSPSGTELTRQMRESGYNRMTPVILISDDQHPHAMSSGFEAGASFFLYKPIDKDRVLRLVRASQGAMEHERRRTRRIPLRSPVKLRFGSQEIEGETVDVSMEGVLVKMPRTVPIGSSVSFTLNLSSEIRPVIGAGCVVRLVGVNQMGIQLNRLPAADSHRLQEFLLPYIRSK